MLKLKCMPYKMKQDSELSEDDDVVMVEPTQINGAKVTVQPTKRDTSTIVLDEETTSHDNNYTTPHEKNDLAEIHIEATVDKEKENTFGILLKNNALLNKIIQKCKKLESNGGVERVINKTLLPLYKDTDSSYKESETFSEVLKKLLSNLKHDPKHKFFHIRSLCEELKASRFKKKVPFITLKSDIRRNKNVKKMVKDRNKKKSNNKFKKENNSTYRVVESIDVVDSDNEDVITLKEDEESDDIMIVENESNTETTAKENSRIETGNNTTDINDGKIEITIDTSTWYNGTADLSKINEEASMAGVQTLETENSKQNTANGIKINSSNNNKPYAIPNDNLLVPINSIQVQQNDFSDRILKIENLIGVYKNKIRELEEQEVTTFCNSSPYILCHEYKLKVVDLYKCICKLTGHDEKSLVKQRKVRLHVVEGHPPGPVKCLEQFLNSTIDETGSVPLPDIHDVIRCVTQANVADQLGWNKQDIMKEALSLFGQCGNALRKQRQKREYKDLLSLVADRNIDEYDPANSDPQLMAKLEENRLIGKANEAEVLERFAKMETTPRYLPSLNLLCDTARVNTTVASDTDSGSDTEFESRNKITKACSETQVLQGESSIQNVPSTTQCGASQINLTDTTPHTTQHTLPNAETLTNTTIQNSETEHSNAVTSSPVKKTTIETSIQLNTIHKLGTSNRYVVAYNSDTNNFELPKNQEESSKENNINPLDNISSIDRGETCLNQDPNDKINPLEENLVTVKSEIKEEEEIDISTLLNNLGPNYITTIFDIEDPFLVIEISDSSDDEL